jgi:hypothetical protein
MDSKRKAYIEKLRVKLYEWDAAIDRLSAKGGQTVAQAKEEYQKQLAALKIQRQEVEKKLKELQGASEGAWQDLKAGAETAWQALGQAVKSAASRLDAAKKADKNKE